MPAISMPGRRRALSGPAVWLRWIPCRTSNAIICMRHRSADMENKVMTRDEVRTLYRPIRASVQHILRLAVGVCGQTDIMRAGRQLGLWSQGQLLLPEDSEAAEMLSDIALFEPNQRGRRAFDRFLSGQAQRLDAAALALAQRMAGAVFSLFRSADRHEAAASGCRTSSTAIVASGSWTRRWKRPRARARSLACVCSMPVRSTPGLASSSSLTRKRSRYAWKPRRTPDDCRSATRSPRRSTVTPCESFCRLRRSRNRFCSSCSKRSPGMGWEVKKPAEAPPVNAGLAAGNRLETLEQAVTLQNLLPR